MLTPIYSANRLWLLLIFLRIGRVYFVGDMNNGGITFALGEGEGLFGAGDHALSCGRFFLVMVA